MIHWNAPVLSRTAAIELANHGMCHPLPLAVRAVVRIVKVAAGALTFLAFVDAILLVHDLVTIRRSRQLQTRSMITANLGRVFSAFTWWTLDASLWLCRCCSNALVLSRTAAIELANHGKCHLLPLAVPAVIRIVKVTTGALTIFALLDAILLVHDLVTIRRSRKLQTRSMITAILVRVFCAFKWWTLEASLWVCRVCSNALVLSRTAAIQLANHGKCHLLPLAVPALVRIVKVTTSALTIFALLHAILLVHDLVTIRRSHKLQTRSMITAILVRVFVACICVTKHWEQYQQIHYRHSLSRAPGDCAAD